MKMNQWTVVLAAAGLVGVTAAQAEDAKPIAVTALSATTISGYVDTSAQWNGGSSTGYVPGYCFNSADKQNGFNVNVVDIKLAKAIDPTAVTWAAGYVAEVNLGEDAKGITANSGDPNSAMLRQAYVALRAPVGSGLDFKVGRFDGLLGYESNDSYKNPNFSHSYGYSYEPSAHTGILGEYRFNDWILADVGVANTVTTKAVNTKKDNHMAILSMLTLTVPEGKLGFLSGDALYVGVDHGPGANVNKTHVYAGSSINTPYKKLTFGVAYDAIFNNDVNNGDYFTDVAGYVNFKATEKLSLNGRVEYAHGDLYTYDADGNNAYQFRKVLALTGTVSYDLWANVTTRLEVRWDHSPNRPYGENHSDKEAVMVAGNVIYKF